MEGPGVAFLRALLEKFLSISDWYNASNFFPGSPLVPISVGLCSREPCLTDIGPKET
jgi:hypothetical protein